ncbi:MAG: ABC transporter ATP-binding protein [Candidatus Omnitrophica bacterium]|nr:ABC transporter ATP-binding protein [Candidatus Omnitrophota bacterium]
MQKELGQIEKNARPIANSEHAVTFNNVSESYGIDFQIDGRVEHEEILAVNQASFVIKKGDCVVLLGANGAGKSTILKLISGILRPDSGKIIVNGRVACLLDLGAGFDPNVTGRANIFLLAQLYGIPKDQIQPKIERIIEFSGIGKFIDAPLKCYSAGMYVRLAFSLAIHVDPDILLIDDCLVVGDESFQKRCVEKIFELKQEAKTIIFVTHDTNLAGMLANRGIFLKDGKVLHDGSIEKAFVYYTQMVGDINGIGALEKDNLSLVFNNGKLYLNWKNTPLSKGIGGFSTIQTPDGKLFSKDIHWQIDLQNKDALVAKGTNIDLGLNQTWKINLTEQNCIEWQIEIQAPSGSKLYLIDVNLMLNERFNRWSTMENDGAFPEKSTSFSEWQVLDAIKSNLDTSAIISAYSDAFNPESLPSILLESDYNSDFKIPRAIITGLEQSSRVLSLGVTTLGAQNHFSGRIKLFDNSYEFSSYLAFKQSKFIKERIIQEGNTKLFFDNGRVRLFYKEFELTKSPCFFSTFYHSDKWFNSFDGIIEFKKQEANIMFLNVRWPELNVNQEWQVSLLSELEILWKIILRVEEGIDILSSRNAIFLSDHYNEWFSTYEEGSFPKDFLWQDIILENNKRKTVGLKNANLYPGLVLDVAGDTNNSLPVIQNTDSLYQARTLSAFTIHSKKDDGSTFPPGSYDYFSGNIKIYPNKKPIDEYIAVNKKEKLDEDLKSHVHTIAENIIQDKATKIIFEIGAVRIFYNELELTEGPGIRTIFDVYDINKQLDSNNARWQINKTSDNKITCFLRWDHITSIMQQWDFFIENNTVKLLIAMVSYKHANIYNEHAGLLLSKNYKHWSTASEEGNVDYNFMGTHTGVPLKNNKSKIFYVREYAEKGTTYSSVIFNSFSAVIPEVASVSLDKDNGLGMYFLKADQRESLNKTPGEYVYFSGEIILGKEYSKDEGALENIPKHTFDLSVLKPLELFFSNGAIKLFWKKKEITEGLGIYASFSSCGQWHDSGQAVWRIDEVSPDTLKATGIWPWIPVIQSWHIKLGKRCISLEINNEIYRKAYLNAEEVNIFLVNEYNHWFSAKNHGRFYEEFSQSDLFRFRMWVTKLTHEKTGVKKKFFSLPSISLRSLNKIEDAFLVIENASIQGDKGRLIQYLKINKEEASLKNPGNYCFFKGIVGIDNA